MLEVSCAIIKNHKNEVLVTQRSEKMSLPLKWEFPGGKIEKNETPEECLIREIKEELNIEVVIERSSSIVEHQYDTFTIRLFPFICRIQNGKIQLAEHLSYVWLPKNELLCLDWAEADLPILHEYFISIS